MTPYLDPSAMVRARKLNLTPEGMTRTHTLAEFYSTLTGPGVLAMIKGREVKEKLSPADAATAARQTFARVKFVDLKSAEVLDRLTRAAAKNVQGRNIHDYLHAAAAEKAGCDRLVTLNFKDFSPLTELRLVHPAKHFATGSNEPVTKHAS